jgi:2-polyprenyl-3-methyl-5-hydroxy-6-metoxy-1,4-benzoquinol methylase
MLKQPRRDRRLLDVGAGGCDIDLWLIKTCRAKGLRLNITCLDHDRRVIADAHSKTRNVPNIKRVCANATEIQLLGRRFDYVIANHVLHHFTAPDIGIFLKKVDSVCERVLLVNDLLRSRCSYVFFAAFAKVFLRNSCAYTDGRISIRKGFTKPQLCEMLRNRRSACSALIDTTFPDTFMSSKITDQLTKKNRPVGKLK